MKSLSRGAHECQNKIKWQAFQQFLRYFRPDKLTDSFDRKLRIILGHLYHCVF